MGKAIRAQVRIILPDIGAFDPMPQTKHPSHAPQLLSSVTVAHLPARPVNAHKGDFGHVLVVGGDLGTGGAVLLSAEAALRCGAGLVSVATRPEHVSASLARLPETMCLGVSSANQLMGVLERASVLVVGPGLGQAAWGRSLLSAVANAEQPQVWDADALNLLARTPWPCPVAASSPRIRGGGAAAGYFHRSGTGRPPGRGAQARAPLQQRLRAQGRRHPGGRPGRATDAVRTGPPAMAGAGFGDVLTGVLAALLAQGLDAWQAAGLGVWLHACAGERLGVKVEAWRPVIWRRSFVSYWRSILRVWHNPVSGR